MPEPISPSHSEKFRGSHAFIMMKLANSQLQAAKLSGPKTSHVLPNLVSIEKNIATMNQDINKYKDHLSEVLSQLEDNITQLGSNPKNLKAMDNQRLYLPELAGLKVQVTDLINQREALKETIKSFVQEKNTRFAEIFALPVNQQKSAFEDMIKKMQDVHKQIGRLNINDIAVQSNADKLQRKVEQTMRVDLGIVPPKRDEAPIRHL